MRPSCLSKLAVSSTVLEIDMSGADAVFQPSSSEDDFFNFGISTEASSKQHLEYLNDNSKELAMLEKYPNIQASVHHIISYLICSTTVQQFYGNIIHSEQDNQARGALIVARKTRPNIKSINVTTTIILR